MTEEMRERVNYRVEICKKEEPIDRDNYQPLLIKFKYLSGTMSPKLGKMLQPPEISNSHIYILLSDLHTTQKFGQSKG